jgi:hypothetical protein
MAEKTAPVFDALRLLLSQLHCKGTTDKNSAVRFCPHLSVFLLQKEKILENVNIFS